MRRSPAIFGVTLPVAFFALAAVFGVVRAEPPAANSPGCFAAPAAVDSADSWVFRQSRYSHDPATGRRVNQFAPKAPSLVAVDPNYLQSGYRHKRSTLRGADGSADRLHVVETWGAGDSIRPYGEWLFPYRAGATPYGPWGNPQGPWTAPFDSWVNPYGTWNRYPLYGHPFPTPHGQSGGAFRKKPGWPHPKDPHGRPPHGGDPHGRPPHNLPPHGGHDHGGFPHGSHSPTGPHGTIDH